MLLSEVHFGVDRIRVICIPFFFRAQVFLGHSGGLDTEGNELPRLVYVSREKRPGFQHHKKAGAMNALVCVSDYLSCYTNISLVRPFLDD